MQRRDARGFLEEVLARVSAPERLSAETREKLLAVVGDKPGTKRASKLAAILAEPDDEDRSNHRGDSRGAGENG